MILQYTTDKYGKDILVDNSGKHQIMMEWEKPYMEACIEKLNPCKKVLEIGFGMGYSATKICSFERVTHYTVIECCPIVWEKIEIFKRKYPHIEINLIKGRWQDVLSLCDVFDCIFFDDYSSEHKRLLEFLFLILQNHTKIGSRISYYSQSNLKFDLKNICFELSEFDIEIPDNCNYVQGKKMYIPLITKVNNLKFNDWDEFNLAFYRHKQPLVARLANQTKFTAVPSKNLYPGKPFLHNILVIDHFYCNPLEVHDFVLQQNFKTNNNDFCGKKTVLCFSDEIQQTFENILKVKITIPNPENFGSFYKLTCRDNPKILNIKGLWCGIIFLSKYAPIESGLGFYNFKNGNMYVDDFKDTLNSEYMFDFSEWDLRDTIGNVFNRLILFNCSQFFSLRNYFGNEKDSNVNFFQIFLFSI